MIGRVTERVAEEFRGATLGFRAIYERDFLVLTSQPRFLVLRTAAALIVVGLALVMLLVDEIHPDERATFVFNALWITLPLMIALLGPPMAAAAISGERSLGTLELVLAAPIRPFWFVVGKLLSRFSTLMIFLLVSVPVIGVSLLYGGVSGAQLLRYIAMTAGLALWATAAGILASTFCKRVSVAVLWGYLLGVLVPVAHVIAIGNLMASPWSPGGLTVRNDWWFFTLTPGACWLMELVKRGFGGVPEDPGIAALRSGAIFAALTLIVCTWRISREAAFTSRVALRGRRNRPMLSLNPVFSQGIWRTVLVRPRRGSLFFIGFIACVHLGFLALGANENDLDDAWPHVAGLLVTGGLITVACLSWASQTVAHERQTGVYELVAVSTLTDREFLYAKAAGVFLRAAQALVIPAFLGFVAVLLAEDMRPGAYLAWIAASSIQIVLATAIGMTLSCMSKTGKSAVLRTFGLFFGGIVLHYLVSGLIAFVGRRLIDDEFIFFVGANPTLTVTMPTAFLCDRHISSSEGMALAALTLWNLIHLAIGTALFLAMPKILSRSRE